MHISNRGGNICTTVEGMENYTCTPICRKFRGKTNLNDREQLVIIQKGKVVIWNQNIQGEVWRRKIYRSIPKHENMQEFVALGYINCMQDWVHSVQMVTQVYSKWEKNEKYIARGSY